MLTQDLLGAGESASRPLACDDRANGGLDLAVGGASFAYADPASLLNSSNAAEQSTCAFAVRELHEPHICGRTAMWTNGAPCSNRGARLSCRLNK